MQIIREYTDSDGIRICMFYDNNQHIHIWIYDPHDIASRIDNSYPTLEAAEKDFNAYLS